MEDFETVSADVTSYAIDRLQEGATYQVSVSALVNSREGPAATVTARTGKTAHLRTTEYLLLSFVLYRFIYILLYNYREGGVF